MTRDHEADVNDNLQATFVKVANHVTDGETRKFGSMVGASVGVPVPIFNRVFVFDPPSRDDLEAAVAWLSDRAVPSAVTVTKPVVEDVEALAADVGLRRSDEAPENEPGMAIPSLDDIPPNESEADISRVTDADELDDFVGVFAEAFDLPQDLARQVTPSSLLADDTIHPFICRVDGQAVACGQLVQTDDVAGVYAIGVREEFRRQGIGEAMTWEVLRAGREAGCNVGVLQSTEMAYSLYEQMGFQTVITYHHFELAPE